MSVICRTGSRAISSKSKTLKDILSLLISRNSSNNVGEVPSGTISNWYMPIMKQMQYSHTVDVMGTESIIHTPGLSVESFDRDGNLSMMSLMKFVTAARIFSAHLPLDSTGRTIFDWAKLTSDRLTFIASSEITTEKPLYDSLVSKNPLDISFKLGYIGKASFSSVATVLHPSTREPLLRNINHLVGIDKSTRRPKPLPDWWIEKHRSAAILKESLKVQNLQRPDRAFTFKIRVAWTDTDAYNHTNYTSYTQFCVNALHSAIVHGGVKAITKDDVRRGILSMKNTYIGESLENDDLTIHVWASETLDRTVHFDLQKNDRSIFQSTFVYHR